MIKTWVYDAYLPTFYNVSSQLRLIHIPSGLSTTWAISTDKESSWAEWNRHLLSSNAWDNLLLFITTEGPKTDLLAVTSFPKAHDFSDTSPLRNGNILKAGVWDISVPHVWRVPSAWASNKMESSVMSLPVPTGDGFPHLPWLMGIAVKVNPKPYTDPQLVNQKSPHHYPCHCLYYLRRTLAWCNQLSAQCAAMGLVISLRLLVQKAFTSCLSFQPATSVTLFVPWILWM